MNNSHNLNTSEVPSTFVNGIVESMYGKDSMGDIKAEETPDNDATVTKHAESMGDTFGIPQNVGNAWKAPTQINDHQEVDSETESLTESESPNMESRVAVLEESLVSLLESVKTLVGNIDEAKMYKESEGNVSMNPGKKFIEKRTKPKTPPKSVKLTQLGGEKNKVKLDKLVPYADTDKGREMESGINTVANAQALDKENPVNTEPMTAKERAALARASEATLAKARLAKDDEAPA